MDRHAAPHGSRMWTQCPNKAIHKNISVGGNPAGCNLEAPQKIFLWRCKIFIFFACFSTNCVQVLRHLNGSGSRISSNSLFSAARCRRLSPSGALAQHGGRHGIESVCRHRHKIHQTLVKNKLAKISPSQATFRDLLMQMCEDYQNILPFHSSFIWTLCV